MNSVVLYCKTFNKDLNRTKNLLESVQKFNVDKIPFYISVPENDIPLAINILGKEGYEIICEKEIVNEKLSDNHKTQQVVKAQFWKLNLCYNYVVVDSDSYFIKTFERSDFLFEEKNNIPYTVMHECKDFLQFAAKKKLPHIKWYKDERRTLRLDVFDRIGKDFDFGPTPVIWNRNVWKSFEDNYLKQFNISWLEAFNIFGELLWYGESLLKFKEIEIMPIEPLFKVFHLKQQYEESKSETITEEILSQNFFGIVMQSNWDSPLKY